MERLHGVNERVQFAVNTVKRIVQNPELIALHARDLKKPDSHLRIRIDTLLTRPEIDKMRECLADVAGHYPRISIENGTWTNKWFANKKGLIVKLYFEKAAEVKSILDVHHMPTGPCIKEKKFK